MGRRPNPAFSLEKKIIRAGSQVRWRNKEAMLRIIRLTGKLDIVNWNAEDVFTTEALKVKLPPKLIMHFGKDLLMVGDECVARFYPDEERPGYVVTPTHFKGSNNPEPYRQLNALIARYNAEIGPYEVDGYWFKRPR